MSNLYSSLIFAFRNGEKTERGEIGRAPVMLGQAKNAMKSIMEFDNAIGTGAKTAVQALEVGAKSSKALNYALKGIDIASKNVNPLICVSGGIKVMMAEDKAKAAIEETASLAGMFAAEGLFKKCFNVHNNPKITTFKCLDGVNNAVKGLGKWGVVIKGVAFVATSITGYNAGQKFGKLITSNVKKESVAKESVASKPAPQMPKTVAAAA